MNLVGRCNFRSEETKNSYNQAIIIYISYWRSLAWSLGAVLNHFDHDGGGGDDDDAYGDAVAIVANKRAQI